jgi:hypothetical protein
MMMMMMNVSGVYTEVIKRTTKSLVQSCQWEWPFADGCSVSLV